MGVIYKLRKDVLDRIVCIKKATPALGCRELAKIVSQELQVHVSKSSVNAVLLEAGLSSPVGRRSFAVQKREEKKFEIPPERKKQIFSNMPTDLAGLKKSGSLLPRREIPSVVTKQKPTDIPEVSPRKSPPVLPTAPSKKIICGNSGVVFLWAVQQEMSHRSILGKFLSEKTTNYSAQDIDRLADALILGYAGNNTISNKVIDSKELSWHLCGLDKVAAPKEAVKDILNFSSWDTLALKLVMELPSFSTEIKYIKVFLEDGRFFVMDSRQVSINAVNVQSGQLVLLEKCLDFVAKQILNNLQPVILSTIPTEDQLGVEDFSEAFYSLLNSFENISGKRMMKIGFYDETDQEIVVFDTIPEKRRYFIAGLWPWQVKFPEIQAEAERVKAGVEKIIIDGWEQEFEMRSLALSFSENQPQLPELRGRAIILRDLSTGIARCSVLTNAPQNMYSDQEIVSLYLRRWPNLDKGLGFYLFKNAESFNSGTLVPALPWKAKQEGSLDEFYQQKAINLRQINRANFDSTSMISDVYDMNKVFDILTSLFKELACKKFFLLGTKEENLDLMSEIMPLPATMELSDKHCKLEILLPAGKPFPYRALLAMATKILNESGLKDEGGREIIVTVI